MVSKKEKKLLNYIFEKAKEIDEFMIVNGYNLDDLHSANIIVFLNKDKPSYISAEMSSFWPSGESKRNVAMVTVEGETPGYREQDWEDKS